MLRVLTIEADQGMVLALPVPNPTEPARLLLRPGYELNRSVIERLSKMSIRYLWVKYPGVEFLDQYVSADLLKSQNKVAGRLFKALTDVESDTTAGLDFGSYTRAVGEMVVSLLSNPMSAVYFEQVGDSDPSMFNHALRVSYLSVLMGVKLEGYLIGQRKSLATWLAKQVTDLGIGAVLHDFGHSLLDDDVRQRYEATGDESDEQWQQHVRLGYDALSGRISPSARVIVMQHHQHFDGSGFPAVSNMDGADMMLSGKRIHIYPRIVCVADTFDRLRFPPNGRVMPAVAVLKQMVSEPMVYWFDPEVLRAFFDVCPAFAPGMMVELSDGRLAVVVEHHGHNPCNPRVQIIGQMGGGSENETEGNADEFVDLCEMKNLHIVKAEDEYVLQYNFNIASMSQSDTIMVS